MIEIAQAQNDAFEQELLQQKLTQTNQEFKTIANQIQFIVVGKLVSLKSNPDKIFEVKSYSMSTAEITLRIIFDDYGILL